MPADYNKLIQEDAAHRVQRAMGDDEDYSGLAVEAPVTARFLEEHPVKDNLAELEKLAKSRSSTPKIFQGLGSAVAAQFEKGLRGLDVAVKDSVGGNYVPSNFAVDESMAFTLNEQMREDIGSGEESIAQQLENIRLLDKRVEELTPQDMSIVEEGIRSGVESLAMMSPGLLASVATRSSVPMLGSLTAQTGFASYAEGRSEGLTPEQATAYAGIDAAIEFVTEKIPADKLVDMMPGGKEMLKKALRFLVAEGVGEQVATLGQSLNALAFDLDEQLANATPEEAVEIQARRQAVTFIATLVAGGAQAGAIGTLGKISEKLSGSAAISEADADHLDKLVQAANVPLKTSDPQVFMQHLREVQEQYGEENVYIDAAVVSQALADVETFDQAVMGLVDQAASAEAVGGDVVVPIEVYATYLSQYHEQLSPHVRLTPDSMTQAELESGEVQNGLDRLMAEAESGVDHTIAVQAIREKYADQLVTTGRYDYQSANQAASLISEYASAQAQRRGITPDQVMDEMNLSIEGPGNSNAPLTLSQIEEAENAQAAAKGLDMSTEARMARARDMGFDTETVWYRGSASDETEARGISWITKDPELASGYAEAQSHIRKGSANVSPVLHGAKNSFDADMLSKSTTVREFVNEVVRQSGKVDESILIEARRLADVAADGARIEESGPYYSAQDFWYEPASFFGKDGAQAIMDVLTLSGFDSISLTEAGQETMGVIGNNIRSINAAFDPEFSDSPLLLAQPAFHGTPHTLAPEKLIHNAETGENAYIPLDDVNPDGWETVKEYPNGRFRMDKIGTGEGMQAYGYGLYFSSSKDVATWYRNKLSGPATDYNKLRKPFDEAYADFLARLREPSARIAALEKELSGLPEPNVKSGQALLDDFLSGDFQTDPVLDRASVIHEELNNLREKAQVNQKSLAALDAFPVQSEADLADRLAGDAFPVEVSDLWEEASTSPGKLYTVEIPDQDMMLDWDKPLSEQPEGVRAALDTFRDDTDPVLQALFASERATGGGFYGSVAAHMGSTNGAELSSRLREAGIPGITYKGGTSGERNFVIFDENLIEVQSFSQKERAKIEIFPDRAIIRLGEASDLSSFLHEAGHLFLEMERRRGDSPDQQKILEWLGVDSWEAIGVDQHEQWARGFEAYLFEGQAPSLELREAFRRFAQWLKRIYRTIKGLDVELTDDIRAVMDRMLATDEQIEIAQRENEYVPLFRDAKSAGMSAEEWQDYLERQAKATDRANETLTQKLAKQYRRQTERWWKDELASEIEASKEILLEGPHGAYETIRGNVDTDNPVKLHRGTVDQLLGIERPQKIKSDPNKIDERYDSLLVAIAKSGGLDRAQAEEYGIDPDYWTGKNGRTVNRPVFGKILFKADGRELDMVRENMAEYGYLAPDSTPADLLDLIDAELRGQPQYSVNADYVALYGQEQDIPKKHLPYKLRGLVAEDGASPDDVAARFGYASGAEMIQEFANLPSLTKAAKEQAESRMRDKYGDILNDGTIEQEAQKAAHSEERGRLLFHELRALSRKAPPIDRESLKASARGVIGRTPIKDIRPDQYRKAEVRAARRAQSAMDAGDRDGAKKFKTQQLANFYLWKEATRARERSEAIRKRLQATQARKIKKIDPEYNRHIKLLLAAYDFTKGKLKNTNKARMVANWAKSQFRPDESIAVQMLDPNLEKILEADRIGIEPNLQAHRGMTLDDLEGLDQMVRHLRFIGGRLSESEKEARRIAHQKVGQSILDHAKPLPVEGSLRDRAQGALKEFGSSVFLHADSVLRALDGFDDGPAYQAIKRPIDEAVTQKLLPMQEQAGKDIAELYDQHYTFKELRANNKAQAVAGREMSKWQMISLALNWGNQSSREAVLASTLGGEQKWTQEQVSEVLDRLDKRDWQFVQGVWDYIDTYWSKVAEVERKRNGVVPPKVEAVPVETRYGIMRGGYYPLKYDSEKSVKVSQQEADELMSHITSGAMAKAAAKDGFTKARVGSGGRPVLLEIDVFHRHINESIQFIAMTEAVANVNAVLSSQEVKVAAEATGNQAAIKNLDMWLRDAAVGEVLSGDVMSKVFRNLRTGFSAMSIGWNVGTIMMQPLGLLQSLPVIGYGNMAKGVRAFVSAPGETMRRVQEMSVFMRERGATFNKDIRDTLSALHGDPNKPTFIPEKVRQSFFAGIVYTQRFVDTITWLGTYEGTKGKPESDRIYAADRSVARSQASGIWSDRTPIERGTISRETRQSEWVRMWTALGSYFFAKGNIAQERYRATDFKSPVQASRFVADMLVLFTVEALLVGMLRGTMPDEEDDESKLAFAAKETGLSVMASIPFVREVGSILAGFGGAPTYTTAAKSVADVGIQLGQAENDAALWKSINNLGGMLFKYPSRQINRTVGTFIDDINGEDVDLIDYLMWREK